MYEHPIEHVHVPRAAETLEFTGERLTSSIVSDITFEHWHRYVYAERFCRDRDVLDIASGEGYGSALIASKARSVVGIDVDFQAVKHAQDSFNQHNLAYVHGSASNIALPSGNFDVVVSMETLEHLSEHDQFLSEIKRVLRPNGVLIMSSPNAEVYSGPFQPINPHHKRELLFSEFDELIGRYFKQRNFFGQSRINGNAILPLELPEASTMIFNQNIDNRIGVFENTFQSMYHIVIASDSQIPPPSTSLFNAAHYHASRCVASEQLLVDIDQLKIMNAELQLELAREQKRLREKQNDLVRLEEIRNSIISEISKLRIDLNKGNVFPT